MKNKMRPIHPGEILKEELKTLGCSASFFARQLHVPVNRITQIIKEKRAITANTAFRLSRFFGTTPEFWLNLQSTYDLKCTILKEGKAIEKQIEFKKADFFYLGSHQKSQTSKLRNPL